MDEILLHHFTPESKQQSIFSGSILAAPSKMAKAVLSAGKVMTSVFWDAGAILMVDYLQKGQTINRTLCFTY